MSRPASPILSTRAIPEAGLRVLRDSGIPFEVRKSQDPPGRPELLRLVPGREGVLCQLTDPMDARVIAAADRLRVVATMSVGTDHVALEACARRGIAVTNTPGVLTEATAECAIALLLAAARRIPEGDRMVRAGKFRAWGPTLLLGVAVAGKTLGIVGAGRIGQAVGRRADGLGMEVLYWSRNAKPEFEREVGAQRADLDDLLRASDFVTVHVPLSDETRHLLDARRLALMKRTAILVNTSRGPVVDEKALVAALRAGQLRAAALDVYEREPKLAPGLAKLENVVLLPHVASATEETRSMMAVMAAEDLVRVLRGEEPKNRVR
ncbi:MAG: D-glycerate dehydrogenase [Planctomycetales bacterium]|nr:D-glycerate dehydrogenase [Planctomycetales bacterium]